MREQIGYPYRQGGQPVIRRRTIAPPGQGTYQKQTNVTGYEGDEDDTRYTQLPARLTPRSAIRYRPTTQQQAIPRKRMHWLVWLGVVLFIMIFGWIGLTALGSWWQTTLDDWHYGRPRTFQTDQNVGHYGFISHFVALNLNGKIEVIETQPQNPNAQQSTHMYIAANLTTDQSLQPVTLKFEDLTGNGKLDMLVFVGESLQVPLYNNGSSFQPQPPGH